RSHRLCQGIPDGFGEPAHALVAPRRRGLCASQGCAGNPLDEGGLPLMQRVLVIGSSGAGKTTFAIALGAATGLPVIHVDQLFWQAGWVQTPKQEYFAKVRAAVAGDRWIFDGINTSTFDMRIPRADTIVWLQRSRYLCLWRIAGRVL